MVYGLNDQGGGQALPPFLQGRTATPYRSPFQTKPMITPKASIVPGETRPQQYVKAPTPGPNITPAVAPQPGIPAASAKANMNDTQTLFEFLKKDLENERNKALGNAQADASARGVYYGTPLTTSEGDINTSFLRGLGQLQSGIIQNDQQNQLARLGMASNLIGSPASFGDLASLGQGNPDVYSTIGSLFAGQQPTAQTGPTITPAATPRPGPVLPFPRGQQPIAPVKPVSNFLRQ